MPDKDTPAATGAPEATDAAVTETGAAAVPEKSQKPSMDVKVYAPFKVYFEGKATSVSAVNATGPFDVLPRHHNFLCMLVPCTLVVRTLDGQEKSIKVARALMHIKADRLVVFMDV